MGSSVTFKSVKDPMNKRFEGQFCMMALGFWEEPEMWIWHRNTFLSATWQSTQKGQGKDAFRVLLDAKRVPPEPAQEPSPGSGLASTRTHAVTGRHGLIEDHDPAAAECSQRPCPRCSGIKGPGGKLLCPLQLTRCPAHLYTGCG